MSEEVNLNMLNSAQLVALKQIDGAVMLLAGAGSGKTRVITYRIAYLIKELKVDPRNILAITFTNKAANEMKERLLKLVGSVSNDIWISTFHSMCARILRRHISSLKVRGSANKTASFNSNFSIYTDTEKDTTIKKILKELKINQSGFAEKVAHHISRAKDRNLSPWEYKKLNSDLPNIDDITRCYSAYQSFLLQNNALDFDDLLIKTYDLFMQFPDILKRYQDRFKYIHIDEFQDTNPIQYQLAHALAGGYGNIFVVGDEDQCIYSWRGASIENIMDFREDFPNYYQFKLEQNYRSTKQILTVANNLIANNEIRDEKELWTENERGDNVEVYSARDEHKEAEFVALTIRRMVETEGYKYNDFAVLYRLNALSARLEDKFIAYGIPYNIYGGIKFLERAEIKNLISYLKLFTNPYDSTSFARIVNFPKRGIGEATVKNILSQVEFNNTTAYNLILNSDEFMLNSHLVSKIQPFKDILIKLDKKYKKIPPLQFIKELVKIVNFKSAYSSKKEEDASRLLNIDTFIGMAYDFFKKNPGSNLSEFLQSIMLYMDIDDYDEKQNRVTLATVHAVKGLEFKVVFVIGLEEKIFPIVRLFSTTGDMEEERRLMFVAITRAKKQLFLTYAKFRFLYGEMQETIPSRFLEESGLAYLSKNAITNMEDEGVHIRGSAMMPQRSFSFSGRNFKVNPHFVANKFSGDLRKIFAVGIRVEHPKFGIGVITSNKDIQVTKCVEINFEKVGSKMLSVEYAPLTILKERKKIGSKRPK